MNVSHHLAALLLAVIAIGSYSQVRVQEISIELGEERTVSAPDCRIIAAYSSSDSTVSIQVTSDQVQIKGVEFGSATVTLFCDAGARDKSQVIYRVRVPTQSIATPYGETTTNPFGSTGSIGLRAGFQSTRGIIDERVSQDEFFHYSERHPDFIQSGAVTAVDPIRYPDPKPARIVDRVFWEYRGRLNGRQFRLGDFDPLRRGVSGAIRGARLDLAWGPHWVDFWGGVSHAGVQHPLTGEFSSPIAGIGGNFLFSNSFRMSANALGFAANPGLSIPEDGAEIGLRPGLRLGSLGDIELGIIGDRHGRISEEGTLALNLSPLSVLASASHTPQALGVYTSPSRFDSASEQYGLHTGLKLSEQTGINLGHSRSISVARVDGFLGTNRMDDTSLQLQAEWLQSLRIDIQGGLYRSTFAPYTLGRSLLEAGRRVQASLDWQRSQGSFFTLNSNADAIEASRDGFGYESQSLSLGWRHEFYRAHKDFVHLEFGGSHLYVPSDIAASGEFLLSRITGLWDSGFLKIDGRLQAESRYRGGLENTIRLQLGVNYTPTTEHEIRIATSYNFEWMRTLYSNTRGLSLFYALKFGSDIVPGLVPANWEKSSISGRVFVDRNGLQRSDSTDEPISGAAVSLIADGQSSTHTTGPDGTFRFSGLSPGQVTLSLNRNSVRSNSRLVTSSDRLITIGAGSLISEYFIFSDQGEIRGTVSAEGSPIASGTVIVTTSDNTKLTSSVENGRFRLPEILPGKTTLRLDPGSLPTGFTPRDPISLDVRAAAIENVQLIANVVRGLSGRVFWDTNRNRRWEASEVGIDGVQVSLGSHTAKTGDGGQFLWRHLPPIRGRVTHGKCVSEELTLPTEPSVLHDVWVPCIP